MELCWDADPEKRPNVTVLEDELGRMRKLYYYQNIHDEPESNNINLPLLYISDMAWNKGLWGP